MNNRINILFTQKEKNILSIYFTAGYPGLNDTEEIIIELEKSGVDLIEIGIPFSDPTADGPIIQQSSHTALENGMSLGLLFEQLKNIREKVNIPLVLMGYFNPVLQYGVKSFCEKCREVGIDGVILPDLPVNEFQENYQEFFTQANLHNILLITPQTSVSRVQEIDSLSTGFIYMVSSSSTTGIKQSAEEFQNDYFEKINKLNLQTPRMIGFGISDYATFTNACNYASGAIIGTAFINSFSKKETIEQSISKFVQSIVNPK